MIGCYSGSSQPRISLLDYLQQRGWKIVGDSGREEIAGLCPLHRESRPSFYVNRRKQVFYCHGCGRGGGLAQLMRWWEGAPQPAARGVHDRDLIARMRIGYAPGACLGGSLGRHGYGHAALRERGLADERGRDTFFRCLTFPLVEPGNLYGRSVGNGLCRHRFLPGSKGGLYGLSQAPSSPRIIVVEGLFDVAALWLPTVTAAAREPPAP